MESKEVSEKVLMHIRAGHTLAAIKALREERGLGFKVAKQIVEQIARSPHERHSDAHRDEDHQWRPLAMSRRPRRHTKSGATNARKSVPDHVVKRRPFLPQLIAFIAVMAFVYAFINF